METAFLIFPDNQTSINELQRKDLESSFYRRVGPVKLVCASITARKGIEDDFHHCGGPVTHVHACFGVRRCSFHHCGGPVNLVQASLGHKRR